MRELVLLLVMGVTIFLSSCENIPDTDFRCDAQLNPISVENAVQRVLQDAKKITSLPPLTVISKPETVLFDDKRNYVSLATYWWPDPKKDGGVPYIRKDGQVNPETLSEASDFPKLVEFAKRIELLSTAFGITGDETYAKTAIKQLHVWFIDSQTSMYPHLEFAQGIKGLSTGRSYGVIDTWWLVRVVHSFDLLRNSEYWSDEFEHQLQNWFTHYLNWLRNSRFGNIEKQQQNNHGTWYDVQILTFSAFTGQKYYAEHYLEQVSIPRISEQISKTGRQNFELRRTLPLHYSIYNLYGLFQIAKNGNIDPDLFSESAKVAMYAAVTYVIQRTESENLSTLAHPSDPTDTDILFFRMLFEAADMYNDLKLVRYAECKLQEYLPNNHRLVLSYPSLPENYGLSFSQLGLKQNR